MPEVPRLDELCDDLLAERTDLLDVLEEVGDDAAAIQTPAVGWSVHDQVTHLAWFDGATGQAIVDPTTFRVRRDEVISDIDGFVVLVTEEGRRYSAAAARAWLRDAGAGLVEVARRADPTLRIPWYGPDMSVASSITARIMETWAHGQDVADAVAVQREPSPRLHHVAFLGWRALPHSFRIRGLPVPAAPVRVELDGLVLGPSDATDVVRGPLLDFCLVVTRRRHVADTALTTQGPVAAQWLPMAQAFAGPPGSGRSPRGRG